jgi:hypothetical protein
MNRFVTALSVLLLVTCYPAGVTAADFKIDFKVDGKSVSVFELMIGGEMAQTKVGDEIERFDLKNQTWLDPKTSQWISLSQCRDWAEQSKAKSLTSAKGAPENIRPFLLWSLDPTFQVEKTDDVLRLTSGQVDYVIQGKASQTETEMYFRYAVLNAYKKAMTERKLPPFAELKAIEEMKKLGHIPRLMTVTMPGIPKSPKIEIEVMEVKR